MLLLLILTFVHQFYYGQTVVTLINLLNPSSNSLKQFSMTSTINFLSSFFLSNPCSYPSYLLSESARPVPLCPSPTSRPFLTSVNHISDNVSLQYNIQIVQIVRMSINQVLMSKCSLCSGQKCELRLVFRQLHKKLKKILTSLHTSTLSPDEDNCVETQGFAQLLRVMNIGNDKGVRKWSQCKHLRFFKWLQKSLNCNFTTLNYLCEITANHLAYRHYSIALLEAQFKNIGEKVGLIGLAGPQVVKVEEPRIASMSSLPSEREIQGNCVLLASQTSIEEIGMEYVNNGFNYYCQFPFFYGGTA